MERDREKEVNVFNLESKKSESENGREIEKVTVLDEKEKEEYAKSFIQGVEKEEKIESEKDRLIEREREDEKERERKIILDEKERKDIEEQFLHALQEEEEIDMEKEKESEREKGNKEIYKETEVKKTYLFQKKSTVPKSLGKYFFLLFFQLIIFYFSACDF